MNNQIKSVNLHPFLLKQRIKVTNNVEKAIMAKGKKDSRLEVIKMIVSSQELATQEELLAQLDIAGYPSSQATLVRDLRQLHISKSQNPQGRSVYMMPGLQRFRTVSQTHVTVDSLNRLGAISVKFSGNIAVIHTPPGHAGHVAYDIDSANIPEILGTVAGDDTVIIVMVEGVDRALFMDKLSLI